VDQNKSMALTPFGRAEQNRRPSKICVLTRPDTTKYWEGDDARDIVITKAGFQASKCNSENGAEQSLAGTAPDRSRPDLTLARCGCGNRNPGPNCSKRTLKCSAIPSPKSDRQAPAFARLRFDPESNEIHQEAAAASASNGEECI